MPDAYDDPLLWRVGSGIQDTHNGRNALSDSLLREQMQQLGRAVPIPPHMRLPIDENTFARERAAAAGRTDDGMAAMVQAMEERYVTQGQIARTTEGNFNRMTPGQFEMRMPNYATGVDPMHGPVNRIMTNQWNAKRRT
jgi:hypothetical protein